MLDWGALGRSRDIKTLFESREVESYLADQVRGLIEGTETDRHKIGVMRGRLEGIQFVQQLCSRQADLSVRRNQTREAEAGAVRHIRSSLQP